MRPLPDLKFIRDRVMAEWGGPPYGEEDVCKRGHVNPERRPGSGQCVECDRERKRQPRRWPGD